MTTIVAFGYAKGSGKDTCGDFLNTYLRINRPGLKIEKISFAEKVKEISFRLFNWAALQPGIFYETESGRKLKEVVLPKIEKSPRQIWIEVGNKMREIYPDVWINNALLSSFADVIIITDLRFPNEAKKIIELGGWPIEVIRPGIERGSDPAEVSLKDWNLWHDTILNDGTIKELHEDIEHLGQEVLERRVDGRKIYG